VPAQHPAFSAVHTVRAGKLRRYHGESIFKQIADVQTTWLNIRDLFYTVIGLFQSFLLLRRLRPDVIFIKGGFVGVPVGLAAAALKQPYITHDSDALPGLANRIIARWAKLHAVGQPKEVYAYPASKTVTVGVPVQSDYQPVTPDMQSQHKTELGINGEPVLCIAGGGLGAFRLNEALVAIAADLLANWPSLVILHQVGRSHEFEVAQQYDTALNATVRSRVHVRGYVTDMYRLTGAADLVVARAGATNLAELALQAKPTIVVPNPLLTGGHQLKNATVLADQQAISVVSEDQLIHDPTLLLIAINDLLQSDSDRQLLSRNIAHLAHPTAAHDLAVLLLDD